MDIHFHSYSTIQAYIQWLLADTNKFNELSNNQTSCEFHANGLFLLNKFHTKVISSIFFKYARDVGNS